MFPIQQPPLQPTFQAQAPPPDAESSYRALIDKNDFSQQPINPMQRANRTRSLLSGGFGRPGAAPMAPMPTMPMAPMSQPQFQPPLPQQPMFQPPPFQQPQPFSSTNLFQPTRPMTSSLFQPTSSPFAWNPYRRPSPSRRSRRSSSRHRHGHRKWYERSRTKTRRPATMGWWNMNTSRKSRTSRRSNSSSSSSSRSSASSSSNSSVSSCSTCSKRSSTSRQRRHHRRKHDLNTLQRKIILGTIREYMPEKNMHDIVYQDIISQMEHLEKHNYPLPKEYDKHKHDISDNEIRLYEQQMQRDKTRDYKKVSNMISFSATCLSQFCEFMQVDWIKTKHLPRFIREAIKEGEFEECMEGIGNYMRGSVFDHPIFSTVLKFVEKVGEAHNHEMEEEQEKLEEEEEKRERKHAESLKQLNKLRGGGGGNEPSATKDVPPPPSARRKPPAASSQSSSAEETSNKSATSAATSYATSAASSSYASSMETKPTVSPAVYSPTVSTPVVAVHPSVTSEQVVVSPSVISPPVAPPTVSSPVVPVLPPSPTITTTSTASPDMKKKKKKGFKRCTSLALPKGMEKFLDNLKAPMQEMSSMMSEDKEEAVQDSSEQRKFHNVSF